MNKLLSLFLAISMFTTTTAFAAGNSKSLASMIKDYKVSVRVNNIVPVEALEKLTAELEKNNVSARELLEYVQANLSEQEYATFNTIVNHGKKQMAGLDEVSANEYQFILSEALSASNLNTGANYAGCGVAVGLGVTAILGALVLGFMALEENGTFSDDGFLWDHTRDADRARDLGIAAGIVGAVGVALTAGASGARC